MKNNVSLMKCKKNVEKNKKSSTKCKKSVEKNNISLTFFCPLVNTLNGVFSKKSRPAGTGPFVDSRGAGVIHYGQFHHMRTAVSPGREGRGAMRATGPAERETGAMPVRSRHCVGGVLRQRGHWASAREGGAARGSLSQETCRRLRYGEQSRATRTWLYRKREYTLVYPCSGAAFGQGRLCAAVPPDLGFANKNVWRRHT